MESRRSGLFQGKTLKNDGRLYRREPKTGKKALGRNEGKGKHWGPFREGERRKNRMEKKQKYKKREKRLGGGARRSKNLKRKLETSFSLALPNKIKKEGS